LRCTHTAGECLFRLYKWVWRGYNRVSCGSFKHLGSCGSDFQSLEFTDSF
jgi:hypothetical protein